jgi:hypothetical protein
MKKMILALAMGIVVLNKPGLVVAEEVCTGQYGQTIECPREKVLGIVHEPVDAALGDFNLGLWAIGLMGLGFGTLVLLNKAQV